MTVMDDLKRYPISIAEIIRARTIVERFVRPTQLIRYDGLSRALDADVYVKHENHNPTGSFKIRGGVNLMRHIRYAGFPGAITYSTGNHGLSIATAASWYGLEAVVVVPENSNPAKVKAIRERGAELIEAGKSFEEAELAAEGLAKQRGLYYAHPANEPLLITGVGTCFLEVIEDQPDLDVVLVPIGAGSEAAAAITTFRAVSSRVRVIAVQAERSPAAHHSWRKRRRCEASNSTFAGGFATGKAYAMPFEIYKDGLEDFVLLSEDEIYDGIAAAVFYTHNLAEGAGGAPIAAAYKIRDRLKGKRVVLQMSGGNAAPEEIVEASRRAVFREGFP